MANQLSLLFLIIIKLYIISCFNDPDHTKFYLWGPGLDSKFNMPVRYFYIQPVDINNNNITVSLGKDYFKIKISFDDVLNENLVRVHIEILDRNDGTFIVRYRFYDNYKDLIITIMNNYNQHIAKSPYYLKGNVLSEYCNCPEYDVNRWYELMGCNETYNQIELDMKKFDNVMFDMNEIHDYIFKNFNQKYAHSYCNYVILNNKIYRKCFGEYIGFNMFSDAILTSLARKVKLPDTEFFINLGDWPLNVKKDKYLYPIVSWCGSIDNHDIILPTYDLTESTLEMMGRQNLDVINVQSKTGPKWSEKKEKLFWRGRDSRKERLDLIEIGRNNTHLIDAGLTNIFFFTDVENRQKYGPLVERVSFYDFFQYKYQLNIDGTVAAYRFPYLVSGDSLIFKQDSKYYEHFYVDLKPYTHYIPVNKNLSNLVDQIKWAINNDEKSQTIAKNAQNYAKEYLMPHHIFCYHVKFFQAYTKHIKSKILIRDRMIEIIANNMTNKFVYLNECKCNDDNSNVNIDDEL